MHRQSPFPGRLRWEMTVRTRSDPSHRPQNRRLRRSLCRGHNRRLRGGERRRSPVAGAVRWLP
ncbi:predicted protein [Streptomyces sp. AA4]|nr:predicted protein [Streptomyces sp. AA4]